MAEIKHSGVPDRKTKGALGDIYTDLDTGKKYKCTGSYAYNTYTESKAEYEWREIKEEVVEKPSTPSDNNPEDKKVDQVVEPKVERRQDRPNEKPRRNYNKYYQQKKPVEK